MNILVIGSGGREHALCWKLRQSPAVKGLYCAPGNGGTGVDAVNIDLDVTKHSEVVRFCKEKNVNLVVVGPEIPLAAGITDDLEKAGIRVFGPSRAASRLESSKIFAKELMARYDIPTARFRIFEDFKKAREYILSVDLPLVVKAYGLAAGKGVFIAETAEEAVDAAEAMLVRKEFGPAGEKIIVEEYLTGEEVSLIVVTDGRNIIPLAASQDHKRAHDGDTGPNTGGMGAYSPVPFFDEKLFNAVMHSVVKPTIEGLRKEGIVYKGVLYAGLMLTSSGPKVLEYNVRFGDPETQVILPRLKSDLAELLMKTAEGDLSGIRPEWDEAEHVCVVLASGGYPGQYEKGKSITGCDKAADEGALVFHAGTRADGGELFTSGGRVLNIVGRGKGITEAVENTYKAVRKIHFDGMQYREDIARKKTGKRAGI